MNSKRTSISLPDNLESNPWNKPHNTGTVSTAMDNRLKKQSLLLESRYEENRYNTPIENYPSESSLSFSYSASLNIERETAQKPLDPWSAANSINDGISQIPIVAESPSKVIEEKKVDVIKLKESGAKTLFGHVEYEIFSTLHCCTTSRRYSDFIWLQDLLLKRYPLRIVPTLPPKKSVGANASFLEARRLGLSRFINFVGNHPILMNDTYVVDFLTYRQTIKNLLLTRSIVTDEETPPSGFTNTAPIDFDERIDHLKLSTAPQLERVCAIVSIVEKYINKLQDSARAMQKLGNLLNNSFMPEECIDNRCRDCFSIKAQCQEIVEGMENLKNNFMDEVLLINENYRLTEEFLQSLKSWRDCLAGFQLLLNRRDIQISNLGISETFKRLNTNKNLLVEATANLSSPQELDRIKALIDHDTSVIETVQDNLKWMTSCMYHEWQEYHSYRLKISDLLQNACEYAVQHSSEYLQV